jgi:uncharacterized protein (TIGR02266 family)
MGEAAFELDEGDCVEDSPFARVRVQVEIDAVSEHNFWSDLTMDVSEGGGVFIATAKSFEPDTMLVVDMGIQGEEEPLMAMARVAWSRLFTDDPDAPPGIGLQFVHVSSDALRSIRRFSDHVRAPLLFEE